MKVKSINFFSGSEEFDPNDHNEDIEVELEDGRFLSATVFTINNVRSLMDGYQSTDECDSGGYFYCVDMILVEVFDRVYVNRLVRDIIETEGVLGPFSEISKKD